MAIEIRKAKAHKFKRYEPGLLEKLKNFSSWSRLVSFIKTLAHAQKYKMPKYMDIILVKNRRTTLKKNCVVFTCMASKAVHIETTDDQTADTFIYVLRSVIALGGPIRHVHTDQGTNFIGAANELHRKLKENKTIHAFTIEQNIKFITNESHASHMGGNWEQQIKSIRAVMAGLLNGHRCRLDSTSLRTLLYEVMAIINCRPLATADEGLVIHPNILLTIKSNVVFLPPGNFDETDTYSGKIWRQVQGMANEALEARLHANPTKPTEVDKTKTNLQIGNLVVVKDELTNRNEWPLGRELETIMAKKS